MYKLVFVPVMLALTVVSSARADHHQILTDSGKPVGWCSPTVLFTVDELTESRLGEAGTKALRRAASHWLGLDGVPIIRVERASPETAKAAQRIEWIDAWQSSGHDRRHMAVTDSEFYYEGTLLSAHIKVNGTQPWSFSDEAPDAAHVDFESVMAHEFGHALGLEHNPDPSSVMYYKIDEGEVFREPMDADMDALEATYAQPYPCVEKTVRAQLYSSSSCSASDVRAAMGGKHPFAMMMCAVALAFLRRLRKRNRRA